MAAQGADCAAWPSPTAPAVQRLLRLLALCLASLLVLTAGWLVLRRLSGGLEQRLPAAGFVLLGVALTGCVVSLDTLACRLTGSPLAAGRRWLIVHRALLTGAGLALGMAVSLPGTPLAVAAAFWLTVGCGALWPWRDLMRRGWRGLLARPAGRSAGAVRSLEEASPASSGAVLEPARRQRSATADLELEEGGEADDPLLPPDISQRLVRARDARGAEVIHGTLRCEFTAGQRQQSVHVAFCPPLPAVAELSADQLCGPAAQIKTVMLETFGASLEVKLGAPSRQPADVQIQFFAFEKPTGDGGM